MSRKHILQDRITMSVMQTSLFLSRAAAIAALVHAATACPQPTAPEASRATTTIYRQVMPDGRIVYSDKMLKGARVDETIAMEHPIKGNLWTTESGTRPLVAPRSTSTPVDKVASIPAPGEKRSLDTATSDVIHAEMLLEDAKKRQEAGVTPLPGERTGNRGGGSRLNEAYHARQQALANDVATAEAALKKAIANRDALR